MQYQPQKAPKLATVEVSKKHRATVSGGKLRSICLTESAFCDTLFTQTYYSLTLCKMTQEWSSPVPNQVETDSLKPSRLD
ncbi:hypothetical protein Mapa_017498 [Marchantia paleacea]|nr:hypothetical protein Mapa_017498 [Marchantia paleacea]